MGKHRWNAAAALSAVVLTGCLPASHVLAQSAGNVQFVVPYNPGGSTDILARRIADWFNKETGRIAVVLNQPGAGGMLGSGNVARAKPDGNTLLIQAPAVTIWQTLRKAPSFDVRRDLAPITQAVESSMGFFVNPSVPVRNIRELIAYAKTYPDKLNYGSSGVGSSAHLYTELFNIMAGVKIVHVPYAGGSSGSGSVAANEVQVLIADSLGSPRALVAAGKLRMIAVGSARRSPAFPDVPTVDESGVPGYEVAYWIGLFAPAATPGEIIGKWHAMLTGILKTPAVHDNLTKQGYTVVANTPSDFKAFIEKEVAKWEGVVRDANIARL